MEGIAGRVALVTGASSGIGLAAARAFANHGATVLAVDLDTARGTDAVEAIRAEGGDAHFRHCDVTDESGVEAAVAFASDELGGLDLAFNNAGIPGIPGLLEHADTREFEGVLRVNVVGTMLCMKHELRHMTAIGRGAIVNTSSIAGIRGAPGMAAYAASKHAVVGLTRTAAIDYARMGIRVNAICPGVVSTPMLDSWTDRNPEGRAQLESTAPMRRAASADEIATTAVWLCSDAASYITGASIPVDGGTTAGW